MSKCMSCHKYWICEKKDDPKYYQPNCREDEPLSKDKQISMLIDKLEEKNARIKELTLAREALHKVNQELSKMVIALGERIEEQGKK